MLEGIFCTYRILYLPWEHLKRKCRTSFTVYGSLGSMGQCRWNFAPGLGDFTIIIAFIMGTNFILPWKNIFFPQCILLNLSCFFGQICALSSRWHQFKMLFGVSRFSASGTFLQNVDWSSSFQPSNWLLNQFSHPPPHPHIINLWSLFVKRSKSYI